MSNNNGAKSNVTQITDQPQEKAVAAQAAAAPQVQVLKPQTSGGAEFSGRRAMLTIAAGKGDGEKEAVFASVHGVPFQIPRGKSWEVPIELVNALNDATEIQYDRQVNPATGKEETVRIESPRFTFSAVEIPTPALQAHLAKQAAAQAAA